MSHPNQVFLYLLRSLGHGLLDGLCHGLLRRQLRGLGAGLRARLLRRTDRQRLHDLGGGRLYRVVLALDLDWRDVLLRQLGLDLLGGDLIRNTYFVVGITLA